MPEREPFNIIKQQRVVIGFAGPIGAGKTTGARYIAEKYGYGYVRYSEILKEWISSDHGRDVGLQIAGWQIMSTGLQAELNRRVIQAMSLDANYVVDGLRHPVDESSLRSRYLSAFFLLYISTTENMRWLRASQRDRFKDISAFRAADRHPVEQPLRSLECGAFAVIGNDDSLDDYFAALDLVIHQAENICAGGASS